MSNKKSSPITIFRLQGNGFQSTVLALNPVVRVGKTSGGESAERKDLFRNYSRTSSQQPERHGRCREAVAIAGEAVV